MERAEPDSAGAPLGSGRIQSHGGTDGPTWSSPARYPTGSIIEQVVGAASCSHQYLPFRLMNEGRHQCPAPPSICAPRTGSPGIGKGWICPMPQPPKGRPTKTIGTPTLLLCLEFGVIGLSAVERVADNQAAGYVLAQTFSAPSYPPTNGSLATAGEAARVGGGHCEADSRIHGF